jgi:flagellar biosynthesis/type III secretory pathway protein FliH
MPLETISRIHRFQYPSFDPKEEKKAPVAAPKALPEKEPDQLSPSGLLPLELQLPAITEKDVQTARSEGQTQGYREGYAAAQAKFDKETAAREDSVKSLLDIIANRITIAGEAHARALKERENLMARLAVAAARKVAGDALKRDPFNAVQSLMHECMGIIAGASKLTVVVSATLAPGLRQRIDTLKPILQGFEGELVVEEDAALLDQDCRVEWGNGYGERNTEELWKAVEAIVIKTTIQG